jgi:hypothetical protein
MLRRNVDDQCNSLKMSISHVAFNSVHNTLELIIMRGRRGRDLKIVGFTTTCAINAFHHCVSDLWQVCGSLRALWFPLVHQ